MLVSPCTRVNRKGRHVVASVHFHDKAAVHDDQQSVVAQIGRISSDALEIPFGHVCVVVDAGELHLEQGLTVIWAAQIRIPRECATLATKDISGRAEIDLRRTLCCGLTHRRLAGLNEQTRRKRRRSLITRPVSGQLHA